MTKWLLRWWFRRKIEYIERMRIHHLLDDADVRRDGKSEDYWCGKADGLEVALVLLGLKDHLDRENDHATREGTENKG
jgi:hypothetical protein